MLLDLVLQFIREFMGEVDESDMSENSFLSEDQSSRLNSVSEKNLTKIINSKQKHRTTIKK